MQVVTKIMFELYTVEMKSVCPCNSLVIFDKVMSFVPQQKVFYFHKYCNPSPTHFTVSKTNAQRPDYFQSPAHSV